MSCIFVNITDTITKSLSYIVLIVFQEDTGVTVAEDVLEMYKTMTVVDLVKKDFMDDIVKKVSYLILYRLSCIDVSVVTVKIILAFSPEQF